MDHTREMLGEYTELLNKFGPDSPEATEFLEERQFDSEFAELAELARKLKKALTAPTGQRRTFAC